MCVGFRLSDQRKRIFPLRKGKVMESLTPSQKPLRALSEASMVSALRLDTCQ